MKKRVVASTASGPCRRSSTQGARDEIEGTLVFFPGPNICRDFQRFADRGLFEKRSDDNHSAFGRNQRRSRPFGSSPADAREIFERGSSLDQQCRDLSPLHQGLQPRDSRGVFLRTDGLRVLGERAQALCLSAGRVSPAPAASAAPAADCPKKARLEILVIASLLGRELEPLNDASPLERGAISIGVEGSAARKI